MRPGPALEVLIGKAKPVTVSIDAAPRGRVTGWEVACSDPEHGTMPVLAPGRDAAIIAAEKHLRIEHRGRGNLIDRTKPTREGEPGSSFHSKRKRGSKISRSSKRRRKGR